MDVHCMDGTCALIKKIAYLQNECDTYLDGFNQLSQRCLAAEDKVRELEEDAKSFKVFIDGAAQDRDYWMNKFMELKRTKSTDEANNEVLGSENDRLFQENENFRASLQELLTYMDVSYETKTVNAIYLTPAEQLRRSAASMELKDKAILKARELVKRK